MPQAKNTNMRALREEAESPVGKLEKVRELLFGQERKIYDEATQRTQRELTRELKAIRTEMDQWQRATTDQTERRLNALEARIETEQAARRKQMSTLSKRVTNLREKVDQKLAEIRRRITTATGDAQELIEAECAELQESTTAEREALAKAFIEIAKNLGSE